MIATSHGAMRHNGHANPLGRARRTCCNATQPFVGSVTSNIRTVVTFTSSAFDTTEPKDYFVNPCCFGDDLAKWLIEQFKHHRIAVDEEPGQEDYGWYVTFRANGTPHWFLFSFRSSPDGGEWIGFVERSGFFRSLMRRSAKDVEASAVKTIHLMFNAAPIIHNLRWHFRRDFDLGNEAQGQPEP